MLVRLMYASRAAANLDAEEVSAILRKSRATNAREGLTGALCLCNHGHLFIQVLEGGRDAVSRRYNRIVADPRHSDVTLLQYSELGNLDPWSVPGEATAALFDEMIATAAIMGQP